MQWDEMTTETSNEDRRYQRIPSFILAKVNLNWWVLCK